MQIKHSLAALAFLILSTISVGATPVQNVAPTSNDNDTIVVNRNDLIDILKGVAVREIKRQHSSMAQPIGANKVYGNTYRESSTIPVYNTVTHSVEYIPVYVPKYVGGGNNYAPNAPSNNRELNKLQKQIDKLQEQIEMLTKPMKDAKLRQQLDSLSMRINNLKLASKPILADSVEGAFKEQSTQDNLLGEKLLECCHNDNNLTLFSTNLRQVFFNVSSTQLTTEAQQTLQSIIKVLKCNHKIKVELRGFASKDGSAAYNSNLAMRRMNSVKQYLLDNGVQQEQITSLSYDIDKKSDMKTYARRVELCMVL